jgi:hypothetical protein
LTGDVRQTKKEARTMKKMLLGLLLLAVPVLTGCEKQIVHLTATYERDTPYQAYAEAPFDYTDIINAAEVRDALDLPSDATITKIEIESLSIKVHPLPDNVALSVMVSGSIEDESGRSAIWNNYPLVLTGVDFPFAGLNSLIEEGIDKLRAKLTNYVRDLNGNSATVHLSGYPLPEGSLADARIDLKLRATIEYTQCVNVPSLVMDGEKCPEAPVE